MKTTRKNVEDMTAAEYRAHRRTLRMFHVDPYDFDHAAVARNPGLFSLARALAFVAQAAAGR